MSIESTLESMTAEYQRLLLTCHHLQSENDRLRQLLLSHGVDDVEPATLHSSDATPLSSSVENHIDIPAPTACNENEKHLTKHSSSEEKIALGNLIALPLQKEARVKGNSQFVNAELVPYEDQWAFLGSPQKISLCNDRGLDC